MGLCLYIQRKTAGLNKVEYNSTQNSELDSFSVYWREQRNWISEFALMYYISDNFGVASISEPCLLIGALVVGTCSVVRIPVDWPKIGNERSYMENLERLWSFNIIRQSSVKTIFGNFSLHFISWQNYLTLHLLTVKEYKDSKFNKIRVFREYLEMRTRSHKHFYQTCSVKKERKLARIWRAVNLS